MQQDFCLSTGIDSIFLFKGNIWLCLQAVLQAVLCIGGLSLPQQEYRLDLLIVTQHNVSLVFSLSDI